MERRRSSDSRFRLSSSGFAASGLSERVGDRSSAAGLERTSVGELHHEVTGGDELENADRGLANGEPEASENGEPAGEADALDTSLAMRRAGRASRRIFTATSVCVCEKKK